MFKATLIESKRYYNLRSKQLLYILLPSIAIGLLVNFFSMQIWMTIAAIIVFLAFTILSVRTQNSIKKETNKQIEIDTDKIQIKDKDGRVIETITIGSKDVIKIKRNYKMHQESISDIKEEILGNAEKQFLLIMKDTVERRFDFEFNSYYMLQQFNNVIEGWTANDFKIQYI